MEPPISMSDPMSILMREMRLWTKLVKLKEFVYVVYTCYVDESRSGNATYNDQAYGCRSQNVEVRTEDVIFFILHPNFFISFAT